MTMPTAKWICRKVWTGEISSPRGVEGGISMPEIEVIIEVWCSCGEGLCHQAVGVNKHGRAGVRVEPCDTCLERRRDKHYEEGFQEGHRQGYDEAKSEFQVSTPVT